MRYVSTRGKAPVLDFEGAMLSGLARDGGLYLPETIPAFSGLNDLAPGPQPVGRTPMGLRHGPRLVRGELQLGELREQRVDAIPTAVLEPHDELVGTLELGQQRS